MKHRFMPVAFLLAISFQARADYQTYVQTNPNRKAHTVFVLALVKNVPLVKSKPDISMADITLMNGETRTVVNGNKGFPGHRYTFNISYKAPIVTVTIDISENGKNLFHSVEQYASW